MAYRSSRNGSQQPPPSSSSTSAGGSGGAYDNQAAFLEQQNDSLTDDLSKKVNALKRVTIDIGDTVRDQNRQLTQMDSDFDLSRTVLGATMRKLGIVSNAGGHRLLCYLVLFAFFVFLLIYWLVR